jgi:hypothetical protein
MLKLLVLAALSAYASAQSAACNAALNAFVCKYPCCCSSGASGRETV